VRGSGSFGRLLILAVGAVLVLAGVASVAVDDAPGAIGGWLVIVGVVLMVAALIERLRYRSEAAESSWLPLGPGGGEPTDAPMEPRFQRTEEAFVDPTSGRRMRVWLDRGTGERRYRAED
jgi:hypothetical protein